MAEAGKKTAPAYRQSPSPTYQEVIADDRTEAPAIFRECSITDVPVASVPRAQYTSAEFAALEQERMWSRVWQMACREEEIPEVGDVVVYESPGASFIVVRSAPEEIKAYYNSCRHRGMKLCAGATSISKFTCPFHSMQWNLDGTLAHVPARWDFPDMQDDKMHLPEVRVERWQGFVFINRNKNAPSLGQYLGRIMSDFEDWSYGEMVVDSLMRKTIKANWKTCIEAFLEAYHLSGIHAQALPFGGDTSTQYDVWPDQPHVSRFLEPTGVVSDQFPHPLNEQEILDIVMKVVFNGGDVPKLAPGMKARHFLADGLRASMGRLHGRDYSGLSDTESADAMQYMVFPNIILFRSLAYPFAYRFLPVKGDSNSTVFEFYYFRPKPSAPSPREARIIELGTERTFRDAGVLPPWQGEIYDQDVDGLELCQQGMLDGGDGDIMYSAYQEVRIRHLHQTLARYVDDDPKAAPGY